MSFSALRPEVQVRLAVIAPLIGLVVTMFVVYPAWGRHAQLRETIEKQERELNDLRAAPLPPPVPPGIIVAPEPSEPPEFLGQISQIAIQANCRIVGFDLVPPAATPPPAQTDQTGNPPPKEVALIKALRARIELDVTYPQLRDFLYRLSCATRPFTVTAVVLTAPTTSTTKTTVGTVHAAVDIERYVVPPAG